MPDLPTAFYFSIVTYTTTGYGDVVLPPEWRMVGGVEALSEPLLRGKRGGSRPLAFCSTVKIGRGSPFASSKL